jgi:FdhD protein
MSPGERVVKELDILKWRDGSLTEEPDSLAEESLVTFHVEPLGVLDIIMAPTELREFIVGHLFSEGLISDPDQVLEVLEADRGDHLDVLVELDQSLADDAKDPSIDGQSVRRGLIQTECGAPPAWPTRPLEPIPNKLGMDASVLTKIPSMLREMTDLFYQTGAFHYSMVLDKEGKPLKSAYDIGRHTAVDKVIGKALLDGIDVTDVALFTTGRISSDIAGKCVKARIPLLISRSAPLTRAIDIARANNLGMVGFLRGGRYNVYSGKDHLNWE